MVKRIFIFSAISDCVDGLISERYSGDVSETDNGLTCQAWANFPEYTDSMFPVDGSVTEASNFCRNFDTGSNIPWCYTTDPDIKFGRCGLRICFGTFNMFGFRKKNLKLGLINTVDSRYLEAEGTL